MGAGGVERVRGRWAAAFVRLVALFVPGSIHRAFRRRTGGVWGRLEAPPPGGGAVVIANHHSWWDAYLAWGLAVHHGRPSGAVMDDAQLDRFRLCAYLGAVPASRPRAAARRAGEGAWMVVFPEARLRPTGPLGPTRPGGAAIARWAGTPLWPVAFRAVVRGGEHPELYVLGGTPLPSGTEAADADAALRALVARLDGQLLALISGLRVRRRVTAAVLVGEQLGELLGEPPGAEGHPDQRAGWVARLWGGGAGRRSGGGA